MTLLHKSFSIKINIKEVLVIDGGIIVVLVSAGQGD